LAYGIGVQGPSKLVKKTKTPPFSESLPGEPLTQIKIFFNRTKKTCCIRKGFKQLSSYSGWRVITKKAHANLLVRAVFKGLAKLNLPVVQIFFDISKEVGMFLREALMN